MKVLSVETTNFGSYSNFKMNFDQIGLGLIYGATGSGKSTVMDMVSWCLFGETAKGLSVDEIKSWGTNETTGKIKVDTGKGIITVCRVRGARSSQNDLYFNDEQRGKDATETQKIINQRLGIDLQSFVNASYFHEFSDSGNFFMARAKERRSLFETFAPLDFPRQLQEKFTAGKKSTKSKLEDVQKDYFKSSGKFEQLSNQRNSTIRASEEWQRGHAHASVELEKFTKNFEKEREKKLQIYEVKFKSFEQNKNEQIDEILLTIEEVELKIVNEDFQEKIKHLEQAGKKEHKCKSCGQGIKSEKNTDAIWTLKQRESDNKNFIRQKEELIKRLAQVQESKNTYQDQIEELQNQTNPYIEQLKKEQERRNPFIVQLEEIATQVSVAGLEASKLKTQISDLEIKLSDLSYLYDLAGELRGELLRRTVGEINEAINQTLEYYFDSEFKVYLGVDEDTLEVRIEKSGNECSYRQLSKGQRQLLRLALVLAIQKAVSNKIGIKLENLFFDEALDGLDENLKIKAYALFQSLSQEHSSILIIDHSQAFHNLFDKRFHVSMLSDKSSIEEETIE